MGLSFKDSLVKSAEIAPANTLKGANNVVVANSIATADSSVIADAGIMTLDEVGGIAAYSGDDGNWQQHNEYVRYSIFSDENLSTVSDEKDIVLNRKQFNITQEENSQYIPFEMPRYYDGFDLVNTLISIHYQTKSGRHAASKPVNVTFNDEKIRFGWLIDAGATLDVGTLEFEIHAYGSIAGSDGVSKAYTWKTKRNKDLNVLESLCDCEDVINNIDDSWMQELITEVAERVADEIKNVAVGEQVAAAERAASEAATSADTAKQYAESASSAATVAVNTIIGDYAKKEYVDEAVASVDVSEQLEEYAKIVDIDNKLGNLVDAENNALTVEEYVKQEVEAVDVSDELGDLTKEDGTARTVKQYVDDSVASVDVSEQLKEYAKSTDVYSKAETYSQNEIDDKLKNVDLTGYATETYVNTKTDALSSSINTNATGISSLSEVVKDLQETVSSVDTSPRKTYDLIYNNLEDENSGENVLVFYEIENEKTENEVKTVKQKYTITGGGGGGTTSSNTLYIYYDKDEKGNNITQYAFTVENVGNKEAIIYYDFSGTDPVGDSVSYANATWQLRRGSSGAWTTIQTETVYPNVDIPFNVSEYISSVGTYSLRLSVSDDTNAYASKTWSIQQIDFKIESTFNDKFTYPIGAVSFDYTPYGAISKDVHFVLDGKEIGKVTTSVSGIQSGYEIPTQSHGAHLLEVYMTAEINGTAIESNHILKDIIWYDSTSTIPVIGTTYQNFTARQYDATNIEYTVYDPKTETPTVEIAVDDNVVSTPTLEKATNIYSFKTSEIGKHIITITCGDTVKTLTANITKLDINVSPVTAGLVFDFNPSGKSNNDTDRIWSNNVVSMSVSDNFDWVNGGYQYDGNGDQYFCIKAGTSAEIDYQLFADDAKKNGKEFKLVFKTTNVAKPDATFLSCIDNTTDTDHIGIQMNVHEAFIYGQAGKLELSYSEEDIIEFEFNINKSDTSNGNISMIMGYEDGVSTRPMVYDDSYNFTQNTPKIISLGSPDCDLHIYRFKVYNTALTDRGILNNFIADARNAEEMISRYDRNQIYDENSQLDPDVLAEKCPWLRVYKLSAPYFTNNKSDKVPYTTIQQIYKGGDPVLDNWTCYDCSHSGQGTSSNNYGAAGRNLDFIMNKSQIEGVEPYFKLGDGTETDKITLSRTSVPVAYLNAKVNIASSNNLTNAILANRYNEFNPYNRPFVRAEGVNTDFIKDTMEFYNCVIFIQETNEDLSTHREFADNNWHFYAIGNIGDSKKTDKTRLTDMNDKYECCVEIMDVELPLSDFPVDTMYNAMGYKEDETTHEKIYTWAKNENLGILFEKINGEYVLTQDTEVDLNKTYYVDILEHDDFSEDFTYGWRYIYEGDDEEENAEVFDYCKQKWIELYRFITTSTDEEFKAHFGDYFVTDTALYYYLFTTRYCMADNRAKNCFIHYSKTGEVDTDGNPIRKWDLSWGYDMDTSLGLNNYGKQVYRYGLEDTDVDEKGEEVFREMDSTFFCRIRDLFPAELKTMYNTLESKNAWHAESFINKADEWQSQFPEELWRVDIERKYIRTYNSSFINGKGDAQFLTNMSNGKMKYHRRQWERSQEKYMASKYQSSVASGDNSVFRCSVPSGDLVVQPNYRLKLTPYAYMYLNVKYGTQNPIQVKAEPNKVYEIPFNGDKADIVDVYSSSLIQDFGDLSSCYVATADTSKAEKVKKLIFGNKTEGYDNPNFTTLTTGANYLLETLNIENVSGLTQSLNLSALNNLKELYAHGSNIGGVTFADSGRVEIAELPAINAISMKNLIYLTTLDIADLSKLTTLTVENCDTVDLLDMLDKANNINRIRLTGIDWSLDNGSIEDNEDKEVPLLNRLYAMKGIDKNGYNADQSVLAGKVHVPVIRQQKLQEYKDAWSDLEIVADTIIEQFAVTFVNADENNTVLEIQYVDKGEDAVDPTRRENNPISPTIQSTVSHDFTFAGWDSSLTDVFDARIIKATYTESLRSYTIKYVSKGVTLQESTGLYGENVPYTGINPTYTAEETGYVYYLFNRWDKSGFIDGEKVVNAIFDKFSYTSTAFDGKELADLTPVEIYAMNKLNKAEEVITDKDPYSIVVGNDVDYDDIQSELLIAEKTSFDGSNHIDTNIQLFDEDRDFVLAIDYEFLSGNKSNSVLAQCFQSNGTNGFKLWYGSASDFTGAKLTWGTSSDNIVSINKREIIVIRHKKGDNNLLIYKSNMDGNEVLSTELTRNKTTIGTGTLVFGSARADDGIYENHAIGNIHWAKVWFADLGDDVCRDLAMWTHESIKLEACGFRKYYLSDNTSKRCSFSLLASHVLGRTKLWNTTNTNDGGWAKSSLNTSLNTRLYNAMPTQIKALMKQVIIYSNDGIDNTTTPHYQEVTPSNCYITIPALVEVDSSKTSEPYNSEGTAISYMSNNTARKRSFDGGNASAYWLRSPNVEYTNYVWRVDEYGAVQAITQPNAANGHGVLIEISF